ncbi:MAG: hypothetical protein AB7L84_03855 [Acidimicrobiia bacterium]
MTGLQTEYEFTLPKGYVGHDGTLHRRGTMRLATARDELEPLRDPRIGGPDDPFLTVIVLSRVVTQLGTLRQVTPGDIEGLFAVDLAYLQDFYGVINFGSDEDVEELLAAQRAASAPAPAPASAPGGHDAPGSFAERLPGRRAAVEEVPAGER